MERIKIQSSLMPQNQQIRQCRPKLNKTINLNLLTKELQNRNKETLKIGKTVSKMIKRQIKQKIILKKTNK
jgi:hypothetical protein